MQVYDDQGNMCDDRATLCSNKIVEQVAKLYAVLYADGMTIVEARALLSYLNANIAYTVTMSILQRKVSDASV